MNKTRSMPGPRELQEHAAFLRRLARSLLFDGSEADDVVQQAFAAALRRPDGVRNLRAWLTGVTRRLASRKNREEVRERRRRRKASRRERLPSADELAAQAETQRKVADAVSGLEEPYRTAILLRYFHDLGPKEIAERQKVPLPTVKTRLRRGLELLRGRLDRDHEGGRRSWCLALVPLAAPLGPIPGVAGAAAGTQALKGGLATVPAGRVVAAALVLLSAVGFLAVRAVLSEEGDGSRRRTDAESATVAEERTGTGGAPRGTAPSGTDSRAAENRIGKPARIPVTPGRTFSPEGTPAKPGLTLEVTAPFGIRGLITVALLSRNGKFVVVKVPVNGGRLRVPERPEKLQCVVCIDGVQPSDHPAYAIQALREQTTWAPPVRVRDEIHHVRIPFLDPKIGKRYRLRTATRDGVSVGGVRLTVGPRLSFRSPLPVFNLTTDGDGRVRTPRVMAGSYLVEIGKAPEPYLPASPDPVSVRLVEPNEDALVPLVAGGKLRWQFQPARKYATTLYRRTGRGLWPHALHTDKAGRVATQLQAGRYVEVAWPRGLLPFVREFELLPGGRIEVNHVFRTGGATVRGRLVSGGVGFRTRVNLNRRMAPGGVPLGHPLSLDAEGRFEDTSVPPGSYDLILWNQHHVRSLRVGTEGTDVNLGDVEMPGVPIGGVVSGRVTQADGRGVNGVFLRLHRLGSTDGWDRIVRTDGDGGFRVKQVPDGDYELSHFRFGFSDRWEEQIWRVAVRGGAPALELRLNER